MATDTDGGVVLWGLWLPKISTSFFLTGALIEVFAYVAPLTWMSATVLCTLSMLFLSGGVLGIANAYRMRWWGMLGLAAPGIISVGTLLYILV